MDWEIGALWKLRDEQAYTFIEQKYKNRQSLQQYADLARKLSDSSQTIDGKPNPHHPLLEARAEVAQLRLEMSYMIERNAHLQGYVEQIEFLYQRVSIVEGAYQHTKLLAETAKIDYSLIRSLADRLNKFLTERKNDTGKT